MTLQQPKPIDRQNYQSIRQTQGLCHKCRAPIIFNKDKVGPKGKKVPLDPYFNNEPHVKYCMYFAAPSNSDLEPLLFDFLSKVPNRGPKRIIGEVGRAF
jgi:hypothetical protein